MKATTLNQHILALATTICASCVKLSPLLARQRSRASRNATPSWKRTSLPCCGRTTTRRATMSNSFTTSAIPSDFLSKTDKAFLSELVMDWLQEKGTAPESFSFSIEVSWTQENNDES